MSTRLPTSSRLRWAALPLVLALGGCDIMGILGIETAGQIAEQKEAEGKAIGSGCRHAERSIEECYQNNTRASKAAVFAGWREMDEYMRENKIAAMPPRTKPAMIDETADGSPVNIRPSTAQSASLPTNRAGSPAAPTNQVRPTGTAPPPVTPATPKVRPVLPAVTPATSQRNG